MTDYNREHVTARSQREQGGSNHATDPAVSTASRAVVRDPAGRFVSGSARPPARRSGAARGNLNAVRAPWRTFWLRRALRSEDSWVRRIVAEHAGSLASDKPDASAGELRTIELAAVARGCTCLVLDALRAQGGVTGPKAEGLLGVLGRFMTLEQRSLVALGLERRARPALSLGDLLRGQGSAEAHGDPA